MSLSNKYSIYLIVIVLLSSCTGTSQSNTNMAKDTPEVNAMLEAFNKQQHRIELNGCEMLYNGKPFQLGMSIEELILILGNPQTTEKAFNGNNFHTWFDGILSIREGNTHKKLDYISINFLDGESKVKTYILFQGVPISKESLMADFIYNSVYEFSNFSKGNHSYEKTFSNCKKPIEYYISSKVPWVYKGGGHLMTKSHIDYDNTYPIEAIVIKLKK